MLAALLIGFFVALTLGATFLTTALPGDDFLATLLGAAAFFAGAFFAGTFFAGAFFTGAFVKEAFFAAAFFATTFFSTTFLVGAAFFAEVFAGAFLLADLGDGFFAADFAEALTVDLLALFTFRSLFAAAFELPALTAALADVSLLRAFAPVELALLFAISLHHG